MVLRTVDLRIILIVDQLKVHLYYEEDWQWQFHRDSIKRGVFSKHLSIIRAPWNLRGLCSATQMRDFQSSPSRMDSFERCCAVINRLYEMDDVQLRLREALKKHHISLLIQSYWVSTNSSSLRAIAIFKKTREGRKSTSFKLPHLFVLLGCLLSL